MTSPPVYVGIEFVLLFLARCCLTREKRWLAFALIVSLGAAMGVYGLDAERWFDSQYKDDGMGAMLITVGSFFALIGFGVLLVVAAWSAARDASRAKKSKLPRDPT